MGEAMTDDEIKDMAYERVVCALTPEDVDSGNALEAVAAFGRTVRDRITISDIHAIGPCEHGIADDAKCNECCSLPTWHELRRERDTAQAEIERLKTFAARQEGRCIEHRRERVAARREAATAWRVEKQVAAERDEARAEREKWKKTAAKGGSVEQVCAKAEMWVDIIVASLPTFASPANYEQARQVISEYVGLISCGKWRGGDVMVADNGGGIVPIIDTKQNHAGDIDDTHFDGDDCPATPPSTAQPTTTAKEPDAWAYEQWTLCPRCSGPSSSLCNKCRDEVAATPYPAAPLIVGRKVISEPGASIRLEVLELSEEAQRGLSVGKEAAENFLRAPSVVREAMRCRTCDYLTDVLICTKCGTPSPAARGSELLNALMGACQKGPGEEVNAAFSELLDYVVGLERGVSAVISSNRDEDAAWTAHKALVQARATIKLAVECEDGIDGAQAEVTFRMIAAALAALDAARSKETK
jgi:hypothetical protein